MATLINDNYDECECDVIIVKYENTRAFTVNN